MAEEDEDKGNGLSVRGARQRLDPEKGPIGVAVGLQERADKALEEHLFEVIECLLHNIRAKHLPSVRLLMALARRLDAREDVLEGEYLSLAEVLWVEFQEVQGIGNRE